MLRISFIALYIFSLISFCQAQTDSLNVLKAQWNIHQVSRGIRLKQMQFTNNLFQSNQHISILEVKQKRRYFFDLGFEKQVLRTTSDFGKSAGAIAAINGTFFDVKNGGSVDLIKSDGMVINGNRLQKNEQRAIHQKAAVSIANGRISLEKWNGKTDWENTLKGEDLMNSGPLLMLDHRMEKLDTANAFNKTRHPRSAIAIRGRKVLLIAVDGRNEHAAGMSLFELSKILSWLGCRDGINLDGGGSTTLWINGQPGNGVVNYPSDNKKWDHEGERKVANVILLKKRARKE